MTESENKVCTCGRDYTHCRHCGKKNPYPHKAESMRKSKELNQFVTVYSCQTCSHYTHELMECVAPPKFVAPVHQAGSKPVKVVPVDNRPQFVLTPGSPEYIEAFEKRYNEIAGDMRRRSNLSVMDEMLKDGWVNEFPNIPGPSTPEVPVTEVPVVDISFDDIIAKMKEESK